jgi:hypothetical protein
LFSTCCYLLIRQRSQRHFLFFELLLNTHKNHIHIWSNFSYPNIILEKNWALPS